MTKSKKKEPILDAPIAIPLNAHIPLLPMGHYGDGRGATFHREGYTTILRLSDMVPKAPKFHSGRGRKENSGEVPADHIIAHVNDLLEKKGEGYNKDKAFQECAKRFNWEKDSVKDIYYKAFRRNKSQMIVQVSDSADTQANVPPDFESFLTDLKKALSAAYRYSPEYFVQYIKQNYPDGSIKKAMTVYIYELEELLPKLPLYTSASILIEETKVIEKWMGEARVLIEKPDIDSLSETEILAFLESLRPKKPKSKRKAKYTPTESLQEDEDPESLQEDEDYGKIQCPDCGETKSSVNSKPVRIKVGNYKKVCYDCYQKKYAENE